METKINIAEILRNKPKGVKLYSPIFGDCTYCYIQDESSNICVKRQYNEMSYFNFEGLYNTAGECLLFPSKEMRNWSKFAWKKGDVLSCGVDNLCIFEKWANKEYTEFYTKFVTPNYSGNTFKTEKWSKETNEAVIKQYISNIEEFKGGKLNLITLEIEKTQPEFKNGDILFVRCDKYSYIEIFNYFKKNGDLYDHASLNITRQKLDISGRLKIREDEILEIRLATDSEKLQLFDILTKEGKYWNAEKKQIMDLKLKIKFKPFDKVVVFDELAKKWECGIFSHYSKNYEGKEVITCIGGCTYFKVLPFNEETAKLVGTRNNVES